MDGVGFEWDSNSRDYWGLMEFHGYPMMNGALKRVMDIHFP